MNKLLLTTMAIVMMSMVSMQASAPVAEVDESQLTEETLNKLATDPSLAPVLPQLASLIYQKLNAGGMASPYEMAKMKLEHCKEADMKDAPGCSKARLERAADIVQFVEGTKAGSVDAKLIIKFAVLMKMITINIEKPKEEIDPWQ